MMEYAGSESKVSPIYLIILVTINQSTHSNQYQWQTGRQRDRQTSNILNTLPVVWMLWHKTTAVSPGPHLPENVSMETNYNLPSPGQPEKSSLSAAVTPSGQHPNWLSSQLAPSTAAVVWARVQPPRIDSSVRSAGFISHGPQLNEA